MEADYGKLFLSNYQITPLPWSVLSVALQVGNAGWLTKAPQADAGPEPAVRGQQQQARRPAEVPKLSSEANVLVDKLTRSGENTSSVFRLAPPPSTAPIYSVGSMSPESKVIVIDSLREEKPLEKTQFENGEECVGPPPLQDDDEDDGLLGAEAADPASGGHTASRFRIAADGVDSDSSDAEGGGRSPAPRQHPQATPSPLRPSPAKGSTSALTAEERSIIKAALSVDGGECSIVEPEGDPAAGLAEGLAGSGLQTLPNMADVDLQLAMKLDRFFNDDQCWEQVALEVASSVKPRSATADLLRIPGARTFRIQVPKPYPGVQYRRSKDVEDKYPRYAKDGTTVTGQIEGEWLRINANVFLPIKVGNVSIMEPVASSASANAQDSPPSARWWTCGPENQGDQKVDPAPSGRKETEAFFQNDNCLPVPERLRQQKRGIGQHGSAATPPPVGKLPGAERGRIEEAAAVSGRRGEERDAPFKEVANQTAKMQSSPLKSLPQSIGRNPLADLDEADRLLSVSIDPFSDTP